jgi:hypothetical protein
MEMISLVVNDQALPLSVIEARVIIATLRASPRGRSEAGPDATSAAVVLEHLVDETATWAAPPIVRVNELLQIGEAITRLDAAVGISQQLRDLRAAILGTHEP